MSEYQPLQPIDPRDAFAAVPRPEAGGLDRSEAASQAALLLAARAGVLGQEDEIVELEHEAATTPDFDLPELRALERPRRLTVAEATAPLRMSQEELEAETAPAVQEEMARTVHDLYQRPSFEEAAALFEAGMQSPHPLVRVAAAAGARETTRLRPRIRQILEEGAVSEDPLVSRLALEALRQIDPKDPEVQNRVKAQPSSKKRSRRSNTAAMTHGTWASEQMWYQPGGDFYDEMSRRKPALHVHDSSFKWSGSYTDAGRRAAAVALDKWIGDEGLMQPDLFAHSHGGTVANLATRRGVVFDRLFLLAWPVHSQWLPDFSRVSRIIDIRVKFDLVITLDRGGQRFPAHPKVEEHRNGWFDHPAPHQPQYWDQYGLWAVV